MLRDTRRITQPLKPAWKRSSRAADQVEKKIDFMRMIEPGWM